MILNKKSPSKTINQQIMIQSVQPFVNSINTKLNTRQEKSFIHSQKEKSYTVHKYSEELDSKDGGT